MAFFDASKHLDGKMQLIIMQSKVVKGVKRKP